MSNSVSYLRISITVAVHLIFAKTNLLRLKPVCIKLVGYKSNFHTVVIVNVDLKPIIL